VRRFTDGTPQDRIIISIREPTLDILKTMYRETLAHYAEGAHPWLTQDQLKEVEQFFQEAEQYRQLRDKVRGV